MALRPADSPLPEAEWNDKWLPKSIVANGWLLFEESKMSKSRGNVVRTETILDAFGSHYVSELVKQGFNAPTEGQPDLFGTDVLRYFLLREIPFGQDGSFSFDAMVTRYNADLANGYGNLVSRVTKMIGTSRSSLIPSGVASKTFTDAFEPLTDTSNTWTGKPLFELTANYNFWGFLDVVTGYVTMTDSMLSEAKPWLLIRTLERNELDEEGAKEANLRIDNTLYTAAESIRIITALLYPILPYATAQVWSQLGLGDIEAAARNGELKDLKWGGLKPGTKLGPLAPIFPRAPKELIQAMIATEENNAAAAAKPQPATESGAPRLASETWVSTAPDSPPRTSSLPVDNPGTHVAGSAALTTERPGTPSHTEALALAQAAVPDTPQIAIDDFVKIDLRVAKILVAERIPKADKLLRLEVDLGYEKRQILSGIAEWYTPEELIGRNIVVIANLAPRKMRGLESHGMLLAASHGENGRPVLATFGEEIALGSRLR
jgi:methionyl-tRNA synthetase